MSKPEQLMHLIGLPVILMVPVIASSVTGGLLGKVALVLGLVVSLALFVTAKAWIWKHTVYPRGWSSAMFVWNPEEYPEEMRTDSASKE